MMIRMVMTMMVMMIRMVMTMMVMMIRWCGDNLCIVSCRRRPSTKQEPLLFLIWGSAWAAVTTTMEYLFILMQQMQRTAMKAPRKTRQAMVRTATFCWSSLGLWQSVSLWSLWIWQSSRSPQPIRGPPPPQVVPERLLEHQGWSVGGALVVSIAPGGDQYCYSWLWKYLLFSEVFHCTELS